MERKNLDLYVIHAGLVIKRFFGSCFFRCFAAIQHFLIGPKDWHCVFPHLPHRTRKIWGTLTVFFGAGSIALPRGKDPRRKIPKKKISHSKQAIPDYGNSEAAAVKEKSAHKTTVRKTRYISGVDFLF
jgi:hypothetical protein